MSLTCFLLIFSIRSKVVLICISGIVILEYWCYIFSYTLSFLLLPLFIIPWIKLLVLIFSLYNSHVKNHNAKILLVFCAYLHIRLCRILSWLVALIHLFVSKYPHEKVLVLISILNIYVITISILTCCLDSWFKFVKNHFCS